MRSHFAADALDVPLAFCIGMCVGFIGAGMFVVIFISLVTLRW